MLEKYGTLIAILAISVAVSFGGGLYLGYQYCSGQNAKEIADAQDALIEKLGKEAKLDKAAAVERAQRETLATERARSARERGVNDASKKATASCGRDPESYGLLIDAVSAANGEGGPGSLPQGVPTGTGPSRWLGPVRKALGVRIN